MTPPTSLGSDGSYIWMKMVQTDGGMPAFATWQSAVEGV